MPDCPLIVFSTSDTVIPLAALRDALLAEGAPATIGVDIAGEATDEQLNDPDWEAALLRWMEPEVHEVALIERLVRDTDGEAEEFVTQHAAKIAADVDVAGRMIVDDYLGRTRVVYAVQLLPALLAEDGHEAWGALDELLRMLARASDGLIYVKSEGYCDADGELLFGESDELNAVNAEDTE